MKPLQALYTAIVAQAARDAVDGYRQVRKRGGEVPDATWFLGELGLTGQAPVIAAAADEAARKRGSHERWRRR